MKYVIAFDIHDDRLRYRVVKLLLQYAYRVQRSVFEGILSKETLEELTAKLQKIITEKNGSIRIYALCAGCAKNITIHGYGEVIEKMEYVII